MRLNQLAILTLIVALPLASHAVTEQECFDQYASAAHQKRSAGIIGGFGGLGVGALGVGLGITGAIPEGASISVGLGGAAASSTGGSLVNIAEFDNNLAQSLAEARANVVGPYTTQLASDLNDAIHSTGRFSGASNSPLTTGTQMQLLYLLNSHKISAAQLAEATSTLLHSGGMCTIDGRTLDLDDWARLVGTYVSQKFN